MNCNHKVTSGKVDDLRRHAANCSQATPEALSRLNRLIIILKLSAQHAQHTCIGSSELFLTKAADRCRCSLIE